MIKISDFFAIEAWYDDSKDNNIFIFYYDEGDEEYIWDYDKNILLKGDSDTVTWDLIRDWYEANKEEIDNMIKLKEIHYVKDIIK